MPTTGTEITPDFRDVKSTVLRTTVEGISSQPIASDDCCVICLSDLSEPCEAQPCGHGHFDYLCLITWLEQQAACPLCKTQIQQVRYEFSDDRKIWKTYTVPQKSRESQRAPHRRPADAERGAAANTSPGDPRYYRFEAHNLRRHQRPDRPRSRPYTSLNTGGRHNRDDPLTRRRFVYRNQLYSLHVGSNRMSRYRELAPQMFNTDPELVSRARMFLRRELQVFEFLRSGDDDDAAEPSSRNANDPVRRRRANNVEFLLEYIVAILKTVDMVGSAGVAEELIREFIGREHARLLLHELRAWLRSPYISLENWDRAVQYPPLDWRGREGEGEGEGRAPRTRSRSPPSGKDVTYPSTWRPGNP
ncbi:hypothetical protein SODALDRAFT_328184 [Sodiomyces alkalinus F11]|uniref:RING-type E3 ubiquitin transferase n=1 Tax=Sodiomyces alkalinus (strain CBS 110278 / VKM F-3762 / F11) TaxID=1314773 RepID=A0A3N2PMQ3_SODAK|nr:hypothetical protein SODALDRAFT_328184 [Sodiomyces alkalinus F11]ROT35797.1 hypothetical protein SODALDRAFT_328184 [Sodiomyces alkalinus F11]